MEESSLLLYIYIVILGLKSFRLRPVFLKCLVRVLLRVLSWFCYFRISLS